MCMSISLFRLCVDELSHVFSCSPICLSLSISIIILSSSANNNLSGNSFESNHSLDYFTAPLWARTRRREKKELTWLEKKIRVAISKAIIKCTIIIKYNGQSSGLSSCIDCVQLCVFVIDYDVSLRSENLQNRFLIKIWLLNMRREPFNKQISQFGQN